MKNTIARQLALIALKIGAIELNPNKPFLWASGTYNPIYNDNRMLLGDYQHRMLVTEGILEIIKEKGVEPDFICGTSLSGIAPAVSVSQRLNELSKNDVRKRNIGLLILNQDKIFEAFFKMFSGYEVNMITKEAVLSTAPWMIPLGVQIANTQEVSFSYLRPERKEHGKQKLIEGLIQKDYGMNIVCLDDDDSGEIQNVLNSEGLHLSTSDWFGRPPIQRWGKDEAWEEITNLSGQNIIIIEDLISTGGSALKEVRACRAAGANVLGVISIFTYGLDSAKKAFKEEDCPVYSVLDYNTLLQVARDEKMFTAEQLIVLDNWRLDQPNWGAKHGFLPVEKK